MFITTVLHGEAKKIEARKYRGVHSLARVWIENAPSTLMVELLGIFGRDLEPSSIGQGMNSRKACPVSKELAIKRSLISFFQPSKARQKDHELRGNGISFLYSRVISSEVIHEVREGRKLQMTLQTRGSNLRIQEH